MPMVEVSNGGTELSFTVSLRSTSQSRPNEGSSGRYLNIVGSSTFTFSETDQLKVLSYTASGATVTKSGNSYTCTLSYSGNGTGYPGGNYASASKSGSVTFILSIG